MARKPRDTAPGIFHVFTHSVWAADALFRDDADREKFLRELELATAKAKWTCIAYCLMGTHYHLLLDVDAGALPKGMHSLNFKYAAAFNKRHEMKGHVHGRRYGSRRITSSDDLLWRFRYVARNPVRAGLCESPASWPWSSYPATVGLARMRSFIDDSKVLGCLAESRPAAIRSLRHFVEDP
jgi:REP-associated tyrosine transposase